MIVGPSPPLCSHPPNTYTLPPMWAWLGAGLLLWSWFGSAWAPMPPPLWVWVGAGLLL